MSAPTMTGPVGEPAPGGNGIAKPNGSPAQPASVPSGGPSAETTQTQDNWETRAKDFQSKADKLAAEWSPVKSVLDGLNTGLEPGRHLTPQAAAAALKQYDAVLRNPDLKAAISAYLTTGKVTPAQTAQPAEAQDEYVDPDVKALREKIEALEQQLGAVSRNAHTTASSQVNQLISQHESEFLGQYGLTDDEKRRFHEGFSQQFGWMVENSPQQLVNMQRSTYRRIALPVLDEILGERGILGLAERGLAQRQQGLAARATDAPLRTQTTGTEPALRQPMPAVPREGDLKKAARAAAEQYRREHGLA